MPTLEKPLDVGMACGHWSHASKRHWWLFSKLVELCDGTFQI